MKFTPGERIAVELALEARIQTLEQNIEDWEGDEIAEDCKALLADAQSALLKINS
ncbi:hypothetical protein [Paenibacillus sp. S150]|uniref:hypothetical protein n=1 Tax=Paenibacillus sp. S150 TaxID=2749826 RepID=UPI001C5A3BB2|nr:hypothetical protein [Paenibacillus sp. S150]MBW4083559.1 hypothetical protein [Paenibacillus sp. S150]